MAGSAPPTKIMIIRHAEKPPNPPNKIGPWDVQVKSGLRSREIIA